MLKGAIVMQVWKFNKIYFIFFLIKGVIFFTQSFDSKLIGFFDKFFKRFDDV